MLSKMCMRYCAVFEMLLKFFEFHNLYIDQIEYFLQCVNKNKTQEISTMRESIAIAKTINEIIDL